MNIKKVLTMIATIFFILLIAACGNVNNDTGSSEENNIDSSEERPTISIMARLHTAETPDDHILDKIQDRTNTNLDIQWVPDDLYEEKLNTAFATNTMPKVVMMNQVFYNQFKEAIRADQFWEIGPYLDQFENLSKLKAEVLDNTRVDGKLYALYQGRDLSRQGFIYRKDWADNLGIESPTNTEDFLEMLRAFTEDDPNQSGKQDTIGLADRADLVYGAFKTMSSWFGTPNNWGVDEEGKLLPEFMFDDYIETMDYMKEIHSNGYMNHDFPVTSKEDQIDMAKNGTAGVYVGSMVDVLTFYRDATELNPEAEFDVQNYIEGPDGEFGVWSIPGYGQVLLFPKQATETEEELLEILTFYDRLMETDNMNLLIWGEEGIHYEEVDGGINAIEENRQLIDTQVRPLLTLEIGEPSTSGREVMKSDYEPKEKAERLVLENEDYLIHDPTIVLDSDTFITHGERLQQLITDATQQYILGQLDLEGFNKVIDQWKNEGGNNIIEEFNASYQALN